MNGTRFKLPADYVEQVEASYFDDAPYADADIVHQPDVYLAADYFLRAAGRSQIIDIGCGSGRKLMSIAATHRIGADFGSNLQFCRERYGDQAEWVECDLSSACCLMLAQRTNEQTIVICADVIEHLKDPSNLVSLLRACYMRGAIVITSTPDRIRVRGEAHKGPPPNLAHIREWALTEYQSFLDSAGLPAAFIGYTINNDRDRALKTIISVHDLSVARHHTDILCHKPLALLACYNEADVIAEVVEDLVWQGCEVQVIDNWSTDATWSILGTLAERHEGQVSIEKFPANAPSAHYEWAEILKRKEEIAAAHPGRWILHTDADELRRSPFPGLKLAEAFAIIQKSGATRVNFNMINLRPINAQEFYPGTLERAFKYFEFGTRSGHFVQSKAWLQGEERIDLASSGGHHASFYGARDHYFKFLLMHYPVRSVTHGRKKILAERQPRWSPAERATGWHIQYDHFTDDSEFFWNEKHLHSFDREGFWREYGLLMLTDILEKRLSGS